MNLYAGSWIWIQMFQKYTYLDLVCMSITCFLFEFIYVLKFTMHICTPICMWIFEKGRHGNESCWILFYLFSAVASATLLYSCLLKLLISRLSFNIITTLLFLTFILSVILYATTKHRIIVLWIRLLFLVNWFYQCDHL